MSKLLDQNCKQPDIEITCPQCKGKGTWLSTYVYNNNQELREVIKSDCPLCKGEGKIKERI